MRFPQRPDVPQASPIGRDWDLARSALIEHGPQPQPDVFETNIGAQLCADMFAASKAYWENERAMAAEFGWPDT